MRYLLDDPTDPPEDEDEGDVMDCEYIMDLMMPSNMPQRVWHEL